MPVLPQVATPFVRLIYQFWLTQGVSKTVLDSILEFDIDTEKEDQFGISSFQVSALHAAAVEQTGDLALGVKLGQHLALSNLDMANVLLKAPSLEEGIRTMIQYSRVISESGYFSFDLNSDNYYCLKFTPYDDIIFSSHQKNMVFSTLSTWIINAFPFSKDLIKYHYDNEIVDLGSYQKLIACELVEDSQVYIELSEKLIKTNNPHFNEAVFQKSLQPIKKILLKRNQHLELYENVREAIKTCLLERKINQQYVADRLNLSVRNLQRRLKNIGTSYQVILDASREELAMELLKDLDIPLYEVAFLVGFTEPSAFYKAFRRWTGKRPGDFRQDVSAASKHSADGFVSDKDAAVNEASGADVLPC